MKKTPFILSNPDDVILLKAMINIDEISLALDTAATHTVIDLNTLLMMGHQLSSVDESSTFAFETSNGIINAQKLVVNTFTVLGITKHNYKVFTYDFLQSGVLSTYDGVLGLDFFKNSVLTIDFKNKWISIKM